MSSREVGALAPTCTAYAKKGFSSEELVSVNQNFRTAVAQFPVGPSSAQNRCQASLEPQLPTTGLLDNFARSTSKSAELYVKWATLMTRYLARLAAIRLEPRRVKDGT